MAQLTLFLVDNCLLTRIANKIQLNNTAEYKVLCDFKNATDCLFALENSHPDIIVTDIDLPDINGIEMCKIIKEKYPKIKVIIFTCYEDDSKILASLSCKANAYIVKGKTDIKYALDTVATGSFLLDSDLANSAFSKIPAPNVEDLEHLYKYDELKQSLTQRELEVLKLVIEGKTNSEIANEMFVSTNTAKAHVGNILEKFGVKDRVQAAVMAVRANLF